MNKFKLPEKVKDEVHSVKEKHSLKERCGDKAFLNPTEEKYPIVKPHDSKCEPDCKLVHAAYTRARQWKAENIAQEAKRLFEQKCKKMITQ